MRFIEKKVWLSVLNHFPNSNDFDRTYNYLVEIENKWSDVFFFDNSLKDIFLTISLRPAEKMIVYNTFISNEDQGFWDTQDIRFVPLKEASKIEMEIKVDESAFEILINQKYIMYFSHRIVPS
ncbi:hypothetical protein L3Y34_003265 [Caenorhabditis briggsae]|uniref:Galectin n=1 Tax=Caenorhabditis briggsae TaxID=6238 RepID=A0AAE9D3G1_CAEBR|nr:hypothetical protein L3Y34_003265 [Caenorhabditis briggsae]